MARNSPLTLEFSINFLWRIESFACSSQVSTHVVCMLVDSAPKESSWSISFPGSSSWHLSPQSGATRTGNFSPLSRPTDIICFGGFVARKIVAVAFFRPKKPSLPTFLSVCVRLPFAYIALSSLLLFVFTRVFHIFSPQRHKNVIVMRGGKRRSVMFNISSEISLPKEEEGEG